MKKVSVTDKYTYDGKEMTEREKCIHDKWQEDYNSGVLVFSLLFFCLGAMLMIIIFIIQHKEF